MNLCLNIHLPEKRGKTNSIIYLYALLFLVSCVYTYLLNDNYIYVDYILINIKYDGYLLIINKQ